MSHPVFNRRVGADFVDRWRTHDVPDLAAAIAYRALVALLPLAVLLAGVGSLTAKLLDVHDPAQRLVGSMSDAVPDDISAVLESEIQRVIDGPGALALAAGLIGALWTGSLAVNTAVKWLNNIHEVKETRSSARRWTLNIALTAAAGLLLVVSFVGFFALQVFGRELSMRMGLSDEFAFVLSAGRWPAAFLLVVLAAATLYKLGPDKSRDNRWVSLGAVAFGLTWLAGTFVLGLYISHFGNYNATYGILGAVLLLISWLYMTSLAFLLGAEFDAACATNVGSERRDPAAQAVRPAPSAHGGEPPPAPHAGAGSRVTRRG